jgi:hypothetical protein
VQVYENPSHAADANGCEHGRSSTPLDYPPPSSPRPPHAHHTATLYVRYRCRPSLAPQCIRVSPLPLRTSRRVSVYRGRRSVRLAAHRSHRQYTCVSQRTRVSQAPEAHRHPVAAGSGRPSSIRSSGRSHHWGYDWSKSPLFRASQLYGHEHFRHRLGWILMEYV